MRSAPRPHHFAKFIAAAIALASPLIAPTANANLVQNGGFEDGASVFPVDQGVAPGGGAAPLSLSFVIPSWDVGPANGSGANVIATNDAAYFNIVGGGPHTGSQAAVFPNTPNFDGYISQAVSGVVGGVGYKISFWLANQIGDNAFNYMNANWGGTINGSYDPLIAGSHPITGGTALSYINGTDGSNPTLPGAIPVPTGWTYYEFTVTAPTNDARLSFTGGNASAGNLIDDVEVIAVPEVSSFGIVMGIVLLAFGTMMRIRRRATLLVA